MTWSLNTFFGRSSSRSSSSSSYAKLKRTVSPVLESKEEERVSNTPERSRRDIHYSATRPEKSYRDTKNISSEMKNLSESRGSSDKPSMER